MFNKTMTEAAKNLFQLLKDGWVFLHPFAVFFHMYNFKHNILSHSSDHLSMTYVLQRKKKIVDLANTTLSPQNNIMF